MGCNRQKEMNKDLQLHIPKIETSKECILLLGKICEFAFMWETSHEENRYSC